MGAVPLMCELHVVSKQELDSALNTWLPLSIQCQGTAARGPLENMARQ
jgi:hypothetical protein